MSLYIDIHASLLSLMVAGGNSLDYDFIFSQLTPDMFSGKLKEVFKIVHNCYKEHEIVDIHLLKIPQELEETVIEIANSYGTTAYLGKYVEEIIERYDKLKVVALLADREGLTYESCNNFIMDKIASLEKFLKKDPYDEFIHTGDKLRESTIYEIFHRKNIIDYSTDFPALDRHLFLSPGDLWIIGARPSMGKTAFLLALAINYAKHGKKVAIFSLEMSGISLMMRIYSNLSGVPLSKIINPKARKNLDEMSRKRIEEVSMTEYLKNIIIYDEPGCNLDNLKFHIKQFVRKERVDVVCVDYLQYVNNDGNFQRNDLKIADTTREIKNILRRNNILGIVLAQLNRKPEERTDKRPNMGDLDGSSEIEKTADSILLLYRDSYYNRQNPNKTELELILVKQRNGATGTVKLCFLSEVQRII